MTPASQSRIAFVTFALIFISGCAPTGLYDWGDYELALYEFYDDPENFDEYIEALDEIVNESEAADRVPPGMYAEYGYVLYVSGQTGEALTYFEREKTKWPESAVFMDRMIGNVKSTAEDAQDESTLPAESASPTSVDDSAEVSQ